MKKQSFIVQQLATGENLEVHSYTFGDTAAGPKIYLQANLHGPEIFGTALLVRLVQQLEKSEGWPGTIVVVPCANPMGVQQTGYNSMTGRWNARDGANWNRIIPISKKWDNRAEEKAFYEKMLLSENLSVQKRLAAVLRTLSSGADYVIDIHTTGSVSVEHLFTFSWMSKAFASLGTPIHLHVDGDGGSVGAFDESHVFPFLESLPHEAVPKVITWETYIHGAIDEVLVTERLEQLIRWLKSTLSGDNSSELPYETFNMSTELRAPIAGYYAWLKDVGDTVDAGETYARVYQPWDCQISEAKAEFPFTLIGTYGVNATSTGEQIAYIARNT